jgi:cytoplasmic iron level regulating protein YaaA (DUF328/UPF0246 family)
MIAVLSPAKSLDFSPAPAGVPCTVPERLADSEELIRALRKLSPKKIAALMDLSENLAALNHERYHAWTPDFAAAQREGRAKQALLAFDGDVYQGFSLGEYRKADFAFAQNHLRILSGLHGVLRPLDLIQPYRLEMGRPLKTARGRDLYAFWGPRITDALNEALDTDGSGVLLNLASEEYFSAVQPDRLRARVLSCVFKDESNGAFKILSFFAKRARGLMADFMIRERITQPAELKQFDAAGYRFDPATSTDSRYVFLRAESARGKSRSAA